MLKKGFNREPIADVANEKKKCDEQGRVIGKIIDILTWIFPDFK